LTTGNDLKRLENTFIGCAYSRPDKKLRPDMLTLWRFFAYLTQKTHPFRLSVSHIFQLRNGNLAFYQLQWNLEIISNGYRETCPQTAQNYEMRNFWPCLTCNIFYREQHRKLKFPPCNQRVVLYKSCKYPFSLLIIVELTDRQTCDFCWPIDILTKFDSKTSTLRAMNTGDFPLA